MNRPWVLCVVLVSVLLLTATRSQAETLVCFGDSLTAGYGLDEAQAWPALLQQRLVVEHPRWTVINAGVSGDTTAAGVRRIRWALATKPDAVLVALGANDGLRGVPVADTGANLRTLVKRIRDAGARPLLAGMQLPTNYGESYRTDFAALFPTIAADHGIALMPFLLDGVAAVPALNLADAVHPNADGHRRIATTVYEFLVQAQVLK